MAIKKLRFPLEMENGAEVRTIEELRENFSMEKVLLYYSDGRLLKWLRNNYLDEEAEAVSELDPKDLELNRKICGLFNVEYNESAKVSIEEVNVYKQKLTRLKEYTSEKQFDDVIERIAFDQNELEELLQQGVKEVYLCGDRFDISLEIEGISYIGVNEPTVVIDSDESVDFKAKNIDFKNIKFNEEYIGIVAEEKINADFSGSAEEWVAPSLKRCKVCANGDKDIKKTISKYKKLGYYHYSMFLTDFKHDRLYGAQKYTKEKHNYGKDKETFVFRNVISVIADNLKYIKEFVELSRENLHSIEKMDSSYGYSERVTVANYVKYSGIMLFIFNKNNDIIKYHSYVYRLGILVPADVHKKIMSRGIIKPFKEEHCCHDYYCMGYVLPFDDIKEILLSKDTVLLSEDGGSDSSEFHCLNHCEFFRDEATNNPWMINSYNEKFDGLRIIYDDDDEYYNEEESDDEYDEYYKGYCPECGKWIEFNEDMIDDDGYVECSECEEKFDINDFEDEFKGLCPNCGEFIEIKGIMIDDYGYAVCPECKEKFDMDDFEDEFKGLCPKCGEFIEIKGIMIDDYGYVSCPECEEKFDMDDLEKEFEGYCPECGEWIEFDEDMIDEDGWVVCPICEEEFDIDDFENEA